MRLQHIIVALVLTASTALASPVITSVTPDHGPITGGTTVVIRGTGFSNDCIICSPPFLNPSVYFRGTPATSVVFIDSTTLQAVTPPQPPGPVPVGVAQSDGSEPNHHLFFNGFTYEGEMSELFDPILFPIFSGPVFGQGGSEFRTTAEFWNRSEHSVTFFGLEDHCPLSDPPTFAESPYTLEPRQNFLLSLIPECSQSNGRLFFVPKGDKSVSASLRVWEVSQQSRSHGVEIPVVRREDFDEDSIALVGVPTDPKFRLTLRVYSLNPWLYYVNVLVGGDLFQLGMSRPDDVFEPGYAVFTDFPQLATNPPLPPLNVIVQTPRGPNGEVSPGAPIWAFITVTNNETQQITTITPQQ